jgi:2-desacetyl-2-hydroxyethyl bacteriochlorophyllide A dehydrogenase
VSAATMHAGVFAGVGRLEVAERPVPHVEQPADVVLDVQACGICGTDLQILNDPPGHPATAGVVLGHEFVGIVADAGPGASVRPGDRVVVSPNISCGECGPCRRGRRNQCERLTTLGVFIDGGLAPKVRVPAAQCHPISKSLPAPVAALAEPLSTVVHGARQAAVFPGETAVVIGAGPIGLMFVALLKLAGANVVAVEPSPERAALAEQLGAHRVLAPGERLEGDADVVVDAVGSQLPAALELVRTGGRILLFGVNMRAHADVAQEGITRRELTIVGSFVGQDVFPEAIRLLEQGRLDLAPLVTHRIGLDELPAAVEELRAGRAVKVEVEPS